MTSSRFQETFRMLKARILSVTGLTGLGWGAVVGVCVLLVAVWLDLVWELASASRVLFVTLAAVMGAGLVGLFLTRAVRAMRDASLVRRLDRAGETGGEILSGYELQVSGGSGGSGDGGPTDLTDLTRGLAELASNRAEKIAGQVPTASVVPWRPVGRAIGAAAGLAAAVVVGAIVVPRLAATEWLRFADPYGDHPPYSRTAFLVEPGNTSVRYGDGLDVVVKTEGPPVEDLQLVWRRAAPETGGTPEEEILPMFAEAEGQWRASLASVTVPGDYFVRAAHSRSHRYRLDLITVPEITQVRFRITPPAYTRDPVYEGELPRSGIVALPGTVVEVTATSNRPLRSATATVPGKEGPATVALAPVTGGDPAQGSATEVRGMWTIDAAGSFTVDVTDRAGQSSRQPFGGTVTLLKDLSPLVRVASPPSQSLATPSALLPVMVAGDDDYGITKLQLYRSLNDTRATPVSFATGDPAARRQEDPAELPLADYGVQPGDVIKLFARAEDNDPAGAKGTESPVAVIQIVSQEELDRLMQALEGADSLMSKYQAAQRRLESLQEQMETLQKRLEQQAAKSGEGDKSELTKEDEEQLETLRKQIEEAAKEVRKSAEDALPYDLDKALNGELETLAKDLDEAARETEAMKSGKEGARPNVAETLQKLKTTRERLKSRQEQYEEGVTDPLEQFSQIYPLFEDQARFEELVERQRDLAERLASLKNEEKAEDAQVRARMRELEAEQRRVREDLDDLLRDIESHATQLPTDADPKIAELAESAREFVEQVRGAGANEAMTGAETGLSEFSGSQGHAQAEAAAKILESFLSKCKGNGQKCEGACDSLKFRPGPGAAGNSLQQLLAAAGFRSGNNPGMGMGRGGGFSARRDSLSNMGLFGMKRTMGNPQQSRSGQGKQSASAGGSFRTDDGRTAASRIDPHGTLKSSGASEAAIPLRYRKQVERYFQQIAEEAGGSPAKRP